jgi:putative redox protein
MECDIPWDQSRMEFQPVLMTVSHTSGMQFTAETSSGLIIPIDAHVHLGGGGKIPNPIEYLIASLGGCVGIKILLSLSDKGITPDLLTIRIQAERRQELPAVFERVHLIVTLSGLVGSDQISDIMTRTLSHLCPIAAMFAGVGNVTFEHHIMPDQNSSGS